MTAADGVGVSLIFISVLFLFISLISDYCCSLVSKKFCCFSRIPKTSSKVLPLAIKTNYVRHLFQDMANNTYNNNNNNDDDDDDDVDGKCEGTITKSTPKKLKLTK